eukprot:gene3517-3853_t
MSVCHHPAFFNSLCVACGMRDSEIEGQRAASALMMTGGNVLQVTTSEAQRIQDMKIQSLRKNKKLALVLDLDHTLLHAVQVEGPTPSPAVQPADPDIHHLPIEELVNGSVKHLVMKKRPHLDHFLAQAQEFCQMTVYTAGTRRYAEAVVKILDPANRYIHNRIVSRSDEKTLHSKSLARLFLNDASMAVILDDREDVWKGPQGDQLLLVRPYLFFQPGGGYVEVNNGPGVLASSQSGPLNAPAPVISLHNPPGGVLRYAAQSSRSYSDGDDQLLRALSLLRDIHKRYFSSVSPVANPSVGTILREMRSEVLRGCVLTFSGIIPTNDVAPQHHFLFRLATSLGASVSLSLTAQTTHLVTLSIQTQKAQSVLRSNHKGPGGQRVFLVHPDWLVYCKWSLARASEETFLLSPAPSDTSTVKGKDEANHTNGETSPPSAPPTTHKVNDKVEEPKLKRRRVMFSTDSKDEEDSLQPPLTEEVEDEDEVVPSALPDMDSSVANTSPASPVESTDDDEVLFVPEVVHEVLLSEEEPEEEGDCRVYYDRHITDHYEDDSNVREDDADEEEEEYGYAATFEEQNGEDAGEDRDDEEGDSSFRSLVLPVRNSKAGQSSTHSQSSEEGEQEDDQEEDGLEELILRRLPRASSS